MTRGRYVERTPAGSEFAHILTLSFLVFAVKCCTSLSLSGLCWWILNHLRPAAPVPGCGSENKKNWRRSSPLKVRICFSSAKTRRSSLVAVLLSHTGSYLYAALSIRCSRAVVIDGLDVRHRSKYNVFYPCFCECILNL